MPVRLLVVGGYSEEERWRTPRLPRPGEPAYADDFERRPGGKAFHQVVAAARAGVATGLVAAIGDDTIDPSGLPANVIARWQVVAGVRTGRTALIVDPRGALLSVLSSGANEHLDADFVAAQDDLMDEARILLISTEANIDAVAATLERAGEKRLLRILDPGPLPAGLSVREFASTDVLLLDVHEFARVCGRFLSIDITAQAVTGMDDTTINALARRLCAGTVVVSLDRSCLVSHGADRHGDAADLYRVPTCGSGDVFKGTLAARLLDARCFRDALLAACDAAG
ncbi:PfkB family carbohydrate kinase [Luteibacter sp. UNCMF366Tsu5.1]|uniref:PfkB family carbohydrate kinase n=1 Tax=Luteibacter sp. UNCMF366Tsu5.1 TaxID=1502758 RepID=UPI000908F5B2|nr:PfkB family carbohydrate kinase [Luteibacter sp. UNCMF366Tsu5.1]SFW55994.1 pfkB family carbohydrate kinase [Luteibacter sp. UNCMF366Tsu5.1]